MHKQAYSILLTLQNEVERISSQLGSVACPYRSNVTHETRNAVICDMYAEDEYEFVIYMGSEQYHAITSNLDDPEVNSYFSMVVPDSHETNMLQFTGHPVIVVKERDYLAAHIII